MLKWKLEDLLGPNVFPISVCVSVCGTQVWQVRTERTSLQVTNTVTRIHREAL